VREPRDGERFERGTVYLAPPDQHMQLERDAIVLDRSAKVHHTRPAIDPLFVSAAVSHGPRVIGVLLSGNLSDGVAGLVAIKERGGIALVQDPEEAEWSSMPRNALRYDNVDVVIEMATLPALLTRLVRGDAVDEAVAQATSSGL
jgi:two-component system chemotaxis response regulator CheB